MKKWLRGMAVIFCPLFCYGHDFVSVRACDGFLEHFLNAKHSFPGPLVLRGGYHHFSDNPAITARMARIMNPYLLPLHHPIKRILDRIFSHGRVIEDETSLRTAGFTILFSQKRTHIRVVQHPRLKGYLLKVYPDSEPAVWKGDSGWKRLAIRCIVAQKIKRIIDRNRIKNFVVADKWLYPLPPSQDTRLHQQPVVLVVKDMNIYDRKASKEAWKSKPNHAVLKELYTIFRHRVGSSKLHVNLPYTHAGKFAFIDTESYNRPVSFHHARWFLAPSMQPYWDSLVKRKGERHTLSSAVD